MFKQKEAKELACLRQIIETNGEKYREDGSKH